MKISDIVRALKRKIYKYLELKKGKHIAFYLKKYDYQYGLNKTQDRENMIVVSMASYKGRYDVICDSIKSLLVQTVKPDKIIVWLDEETPENLISDSMRELEKYGVEFRYTADDLKPHKKYFYAMKEFPESCIITVDDDLIYAHDMIESLLFYHKKYPNEICARRVHRIKVLDDGKFDKYTNWYYEYRKKGEPSHMLVATGGAGTLYPPYCMCEDTFDIDKIKNVCPLADDIWMKFMEILSGRKVVWVPSLYVMPIEIKGSQNYALQRQNVSGGNNDYYISKLGQLYPECIRTVNAERR